MTPPPKSPFRRNSDMDLEMDHLAPLKDIASKTLEVIRGGSVSEEQMKSA